MKILFKNLSDMCVGDWENTSYTSNIYVDFRVKTDGVKLYVSMAPMYVYRDSYTESVSVPITYNGVTKTLSASVFRKELTAEFNYSDGVKSLFVGGGVYLYNGSDSSASYSENGKTISWLGGADEFEPTFSITFDGWREDDGYIEPKWILSPPSGKKAYVINVCHTHKAAINGGEVRESLKYSYPVKISSNTFSFSSSLSAGDRFYLKMYVAVYNSANDAADDYIDLYEYSTREIVVSAYRQYYQPYGLEYRAPVAGGSLKVSWISPRDPDLYLSRTNPYELQRSVNGGTWETVYLGKSLFFTDTIPSSCDTVSYRVRVTAYAYSASNWCVGEVKETILSNIYVGVNGAPRLAVGAFVGDVRAVPYVVMK